MRDDKFWTPQDHYQEASRLLAENSMRPEALEARVNLHIDLARLGMAMGSHLPNGRRPKETT